MAAEKKDRTQTNADFVQENMLLTTKDVMAILKIGRSTLNSMLASGELKGFKIGRNWRFSREYIEKFAKGERQG